MPTEKELIITEGLLLEQTDNGATPEDGPQPPMLDDKEDRKPVKEYKDV